MTSGTRTGARTVSWFSNTDEPPDAACRKAASESHSSEGYWIYNGFASAGRNLAELRSCSAYEKGIRPIYRSQSCRRFSRQRCKYLTQRTGRPFARFVLFSGFTLPDLKLKWLAFGESAANGELLHEPPQSPVSFSAPEPALRFPEANTARNRLLNRTGKIETIPSRTDFNTDVNGTPDRNKNRRAEPSVGYWIYMDSLPQAVASRNSDPVLSRKSSRIHLQGDYSSCRPGSPSFVSSSRIRRRVLLCQAASCLETDSTSTANVWNNSGLMWCRSNRIRNRALIPGIRSRACCKGSGRRSSGR